MHRVADRETRTHPTLLEASQIFWTLRSIRESTQSLGLPGASSIIQHCEISSLYVAPPGFKVPLDSNAVLLLQINMATPPESIRTVLPLQPGDLNSSFVRDLLSSGLQG